MSHGIDLFHLFPEMASIGQQQLQVYCHEWVRRPMAREYGLAQIIVDNELLLHLSLEASGAVMCGDRAFIPIDELLGYIIDRHFPDANMRRELHANVRETRRRWAELNRDYEIAVGRMGTLWLTCKNPACEAELKTEQQGHKTQIVDASPNRRSLKLRDHLSDGVIVDHQITAGRDEVDFRLVAYNPTGKPSQAHWAQPCIRVDRFTGSPDDGTTRVPTYARKCFIFLEGQLTHLPTTPWAVEARYTPGQVYRPSHVDRNDVNPRPLSTLVPSNGLMGCFSKEGVKIVAVAWQPYQELFLGVGTCIHSDFRIGGLAAGEKKEIRGKIYVVESDVPALVKRYEQEFPEHLNL